MEVGATVQWYGGRVAIPPRKSGTGCLTYPTALEREHGTWRVPCGEDSAKIQSGRANNRRDGFWFFQERTLDLRSILRPPRNIIVASSIYVGTGIIQATHAVPFDGDNSRNAFQLDTYHHNYTLSASTASADNPTVVGKW